MDDRETIWSRTTPLRHMPQLDGVRAVAVAMVVAFHFCRPIAANIQLGGIGVRLFFVLSGFLISGILLQARRRADEEGGDRGMALRRFYVRRFLRIFPLYYLALGIALLASVPGVREGIGWHAAYLSNVHFFLANAAHPGEWGGGVAHLWSLAVEEQFYLLWPWIVLFVPRRILPAVTLGLAASGSVFRLVVGGVTGNKLTAILLPGCIDSLALGSYLAMTVLPEFASRPMVRRVGPAWLWAGAGLFVVSGAAGRAGIWWTFRLVAFDLAVALMSVWLVAKAARGMDGVAGRMLSFAPVRYIGTISYGIYVFHFMLPDLLGELAALTGHGGALPSLDRQPLLSLAFYPGAAVAIAAVSWHFFEAPINRLKDRFAYS
jgi:peptidoglycan/LPS O-acetylase OafA/YrhL